jgi:hypothetical protein
MKRIGNGLVMSLIGLGLAASAARWLVTPVNHPDASDARAAGVAIQFVIGVAVLAWGWRRDRADRRTRGPQYEAFASGAVCLILGVGLVATATQWLITPGAHPDASSLRTGLVWGQALIGLGLVAVSRPKLRQELAT